MTDQDRPGSAGAGRALTWRAALVAAVLTVAAMALMHHHDGNITHWNMTSHNFVAPAALGLMFFFILAVNVVWRRLGRGLSGGELAVILMLMTASAPLARYYSHNLVGTVGLTRGLVYTKAGEVRQLQQANPYDVLPPHAMLDEQASLKYLGSVTDRPPAGPASIPWRVWVRPLLYWTPLMLTFMVFSVALAMTVYRQWAHRELVPFPLAEFMARMVESRRQRALPDIFYNRLFWAGVLLMAGLFTANGIHAHDERMIKVPTTFAYFELANSFPFLKNAREGYSLLRGTFYFTMIAVAVVLPSEISFTSWATWPVMILCSFLFYQQTGERMSGESFTAMQMGGCVAMALLILYAGRVFYAALLHRAVGLRSREAVDAMSLWSARLLLVSAAAFGGVLVWHGVPPDVAAIWLASASVFLLVTCRLVAEMGVVWLPLSNLAPLSVILLTLGQAALGAKLYANLSIIATLVLPRSVTMLPLAPAVANALRVEDRVTRGNAAARWLLLFMAGALAASVGIVIYLGYNFEMPVDDLHATLGIREVADKSGAAGQIYAMAGRRDVAELLRADMTAAQRWAAVRPVDGLATYILIGFAMVLATGVARLKMPRFPLHPLPLVLVGSWLMSRFVFAFFIGWLIKTAILKIGGGRLFRQCMPLFVGIVVGQAAIAFVWVVVNIVICWNNQMLFRDDWFQFLRSIYSA